MATTTIDTMGMPSEALGLGNPLAEYKGATVMPWVWAAILAVFASGACGISVLAALDGSDGAILGIGLGVLFLAGTIWQTITAIQNRGLRVVVLERGLVRTSASSTEVVRWDDIVSVYQAITVHYTNGIKTGTTHIYTVYINDKTKYVFNDTLKNVEELGTTIQRETTSRLLPKYAEAYNNGGTITFGKLTLSKAGISNGKETIPWDQVQQVQIQQGQISVRKQGKWLNWAGQAAAATPNLFIFLNLVDQIVGLNQKRG